MKHIDYGCKTTNIFLFFRLKIIEIQGANSRTITVNLLSPIIIRKELENINHNFGGKRIFEVLYFLVLFKIMPKLL